MGFLFADTATVDVRAGQEAALFHRMGCNACPLREQPGRMEPTGATRPRIYCIGEAPGAIEIEKGEQFVGEAGKLLRPRIPKKILPLIRWNNCVRSWPPGNRTPERPEIECFPGNTLVQSIGKILRVYRRWYAGPLITIKTKAGRVLTGTPNHPIFSERGKIPLGLVTIGENLFCSVGGESSVYPNQGMVCKELGAPNVQDKPTSLVEIFRSFIKPGQVERVRSSSLDFHGDGIVDGQIDVVRTNGELLFDGNSRSNKLEQFHKRDLKRGDKAAGSFTRLGQIFRMSFSHFMAEPFGDLFGSMQVAPGGHTFRRISKFDPCFLEYSLYFCRSALFGFCNIFYAFSSLIPRYQVCFGGPPGFQPSLLARISEFYSRCYKMLTNGIKVSPCETCQSANTHPLFVELDQVVLIETNSNFSGHVYNLETESGKYLASGLVVSNCCRPSIVQDIEKSKPNVIMGFGNTPLTWVSGFSGITMWRGRRMPVRVGNHSCWYYPMLHPSYLLRQRRKEDRERGGTYIGSEDERMFVFDLERAFEEVEVGLPLPDVHGEARARKGVEVILAGGDQGVAEIEQALEWAASLPAAGMDYETNALRPYTTGAKILTAAIGTEERSIAFPIHHREARFTPEQKERIIKAWKRFLASKTIKYVHNLAFEMEWTAFFFGEEFIRQPTWVDTATDASILDQRVGKRTTTGGCLSLEFLVQQYFGFNLKQISNMDTKRIDFEPLPKVLSYNGMDAKYHLLLGQEQKIRIKQEGLQEARSLAQRRVPTVVLSQLQGIPVNQVVVKELQKKYRDRIKETEVAIQKVPVVQQFKRAEGHPFNPHSAPEVIDVFYKYLKRKECVIYDKYKKADRLSADESVLSQIDHPLARLMLDLRGDAKRKSTYLDPVAEDNPDAVLHPDGLLHTNYNTFFAETGRLSANDPPVQTYPKRDDEAKEVRLPVEAPKDHVILAFDYGQIQARIVAMFSKDKAFCKALWERYDIHQDWTEQIAHDYPQRIGGRKMLSDKKAMKDFRTDIKNQWTFPLLFGARAESVAGYLNIPINIIRPHYDAFWRQFSGVKDWQEKVIKFYHENGWVECLTGRRRWGPLSLNELINSPVQGTECEIVMEGMCSVVETRDPELIPELMIHDDLTWLRVPKKRAEAVAEKVLDILLAPPFSWVNVPVVIELLSGTNWCPYDKDTNPGGLQEIGNFSSDTWFR